MSWIHSARIADHFLRVLSYHLGYALLVQDGPASYFFKRFPQSRIEASELEPCVAVPVEVGRCSERHHVWNVRSKGLKACLVWNAYEIRAYYSQVIVVQHYLKILLTYY